ncbi:MAG: hybrid sensor histidine kinase/response regulator [Bdellovibrionales bacterium]|nr:hybrid sensor histidine kinase/response regulator [Bdellovibrionales bacterium]
MNSRVKILLVDDLKDNLLALEGLLRRDDVEILKARSGTEALGLLMEHEFALALLDVQMPGMSGFELAELMRGTNKTKNVPIIFVSATAKHQSFLFKGYESGAVDYLLKPLDTHAVKSKVNIFIELYRSQREQKELLTKLTISQTELEQAVRIRDEFMSIASHELLTPITSIKMQLQMARRGVKPDEGIAPTPAMLARVLDLSITQVYRLTALIRDLLDVTRIESGKLTYNFEALDLAALVNEVIDRFFEQMKEAECPVEVSASEKIIITCDRFRIEQVLINLLTNAMKYGAKSLVQIKVISSPTGAEISVTDHGMGIAKEEQAKVFDRFERAVSNNNGISGLGLGLYITKQIVDGHGGWIALESEIGRGSTFKVGLLNTPPASCEN